MRTNIVDIRNEELESLPFGAIQVNSDGKVLRYNAFEAQLSGLNPVNVVGKNFFEDIAPCSNVPEFRGRFDNAQSDLVNEHFDFIFPFKALPRSVHIHFLSGPEQTCWIFVSDQTSVIEAFIQGRLGF